jgi:CubicO group peptidase (beta-lactamase class C family)
VARDMRQLMGHVAGVRHYRNEGDYMPSAHYERASEGLQSFADDPLLFEPETRYSYSTYGWILVSAAVEAAADEPFFTFMRTQIFKPLGMADTTSDSATEPIPDRATFYYPRFSGDTQYGPEIASTVDYSCFAGAGGFLSTPSDLVRFGMALNSGTLLRPSTVKQAPDTTAADVGRGHRVRPRLDARDHSARGRAHAAGQPCQPNLAGWLHVVHDISRTRTRRGRDVEHFVRGHEVDCVENRAGLRDQSRCRGDSQA